MCSVNMATGKATRSEHGKTMPTGNAFGLSSAIWWWLSENHYNHDRHNLIISFHNRAVCWPKWMANKVDRMCVWWSFWWFEQQPPTPTDRARQMYLFPGRVSVPEPIVRIECNNATMQTRRCICGSIVCVLTLYNHFVGYSAAFKTPYSWEGGLTSNNSPQNVTHK